MSLMLRQATQPLLDDAGLNLLHVGVADKRLAIVGSCGKTLVVLSGVQFGSSNPTKKEIEYAVILFGKFLEDSREKLVAYIKFSKEHLDSKFPAVPTDWRSYGNTVQPPKGPLSYSSDGKIATVGAHDVTEILTAIDSEESIAAAEYFAAKEAYQVTEKERQKLTAELNKCDI